MVFRFTTLNKNGVSVFDLARIRLPNLGYWHTREEISGGLGHRGSIFSFYGDPVGEVEQAYVAVFDVTDDRDEPLISSMDAAMAAKFDEVLEKGVTRTVPPQRQENGTLDVIPTERRGNNEGFGHCLHRGRKRQKQAIHRPSHHGASAEDCHRRVLRRGLGREVGDTDLQRDARRRICGLILDV